MAMSRDSVKRCMQSALQAYQADLQKELSKSIIEEAFSELRRATDLSLRVTKQTTCTTMVTTERHLWLNLTGIKLSSSPNMLRHPSPN